MNTIPSWKNIEVAAVAGSFDLTQIDRIRSLYERIAANDELTDFALCSCQRKLACGKNFTAAEFEQHFQGDELDRAYLLFTLMCHADARELFLANGYPIDAFNETWTDLKNWVSYNLRNFNVLGLKRRFFDWYSLHTSGRLVQLGRLQFQMDCQHDQKVTIARMQDGSLAALSPDKPVPAGASELLRQGDQVIGIHIPEGPPPLTPEECRKSIRRLIEFIPKYCPNHQWKALTCHSWLLDPQFASMLPPDSNIAQFQRLGGLLIPGEPGQGEAPWRIFGEKGIPDADADTTEFTTLQKKALEFLRDGGLFADALMVIPKEELLEANA